MIESQPLWLMEYKETYKAKLMQYMAGGGMSKQQLFLLSYTGQETIQILDYPGEND
jgi:hypothetical protein